MTDTPYRDFCKRFMAALLGGDYAAIAPMLTPDFVVTEPSGLPYGGEYHGAEGWRTLSKAIVTSWSGFHVTGTEYFGETEDTLVVRLSIAGRSRKTGTPFATSVLELWQFRDGLLCKVTPYYWDTQALAALNT